MQIPPAPPPAANQPVAVPLPQIAQRVAGTQQTQTLQAVRPMDKSGKSATGDRFGRRNPGEREAEGAAAAAGGRGGKLDLKA
ncbi:MAG TPA: hypothetical protein VEH84_17725 [Alphaproteobacteria bacterium]|nr:hypothetical protein [Alphaproteobacteria bacterium]